MEKNALIKRALYGGKSAGGDFQESSAIQYASPKVSAVPGRPRCLDEDNKELKWLTMLRVDASVYILCISDK